MTALLAALAFAAVVGWCFAFLWMHRARKLARDFNELATEMHRSITEQEEIADALDVLDARLTAALTELDIP